MLVVRPSPLRVSRARPGLSGHPAPAWVMEDAMDVRVAVRLSLLPGSEYLERCA